MTDWEYSRSARRFRDADTGRFVSAQAVVDLRDGFQERRRADLDVLTRRLADREMTVQDWERGVTQAIRGLHTAQYALGRGGLNAMTDADYTRADEMVEHQRGYLRAFAEDVAAGNLSEAQIAARSKLYHAASTTAHEAGRASSWGVAPPNLPGDGSTPCKSNCRCSIAYREKQETVELRWQLHSGESCSGCAGRAAAWTPLVIDRPADGRIARLYRRVA